MNKVKLQAGMLVYHGTDCDDFNEDEDSLDGPAWVSSSRAVAEFFVTNRAGWGGQRRLITYVLACDVELYEVRSRDDMQRLAEKFNLLLDGTEEIRESVRESGIEGWIIPNNYPDGDDILIADPGCVLEYQATEELPGAPGDRPKPKEF